MAVASDSFTGVDLSRLPAPAVVEPLGYEAIRSAALATFTQLAADAGLPFDATVESDPVVKLIEVFAWREVVLRSRVNDAARAVMPAFATGSDLDHLAALFGIERFELVAADPQNQIEQVLESDTDFRRRLVLAPEGYSVAGPEGAYIFHAISADADVLDASATSPTPGEVVVAVLARSGTGAAGAPMLANVTAALTSDSVRPLTDHVTVQSAAIVNFAVTATITFLNGPDRSVVLASSQARLAAHLADIRRLGRDVTRAGIIAALHAPGVQNVVLAAPAADIALTRLQAGYCTAITLIDAGVAE